MIKRPPQATPLTPPTPDDYPLMRPILNAAQQMFPGATWEDVEPHLCRAWRTILEPTPWEAVREWMQASWMQLGSNLAANDGDTANTAAHPSP